MEPLSQTLKDAELSKVFQELRTSSLKRNVKELKHGKLDIKDFKNNLSNSMDSLKRRDSSLSKDSSQDSPEDLESSGNVSFSLVQPSSEIQRRLSMLSSLDGDEELSTTSSHLNAADYSSLSDMQNDFSLEHKAFAHASKSTNLKEQTSVTSSLGLFNQQQHLTATQLSQSSYKISSKTASSRSATSSSSSNSINSVSLNSSISNKRITEDELLMIPLDDIEDLDSSSDAQEVDKTINKYSGYLDVVIDALKVRNSVKLPLLLNRVNEIVRKAWAVPSHGHKFGFSLCNTLRVKGGLDLLMSSCGTEDEGDSEAQFSSAMLLEQCLTTENRAHVVENGLEKVVNVACVCTKNANSAEKSRVGTGILEHLFKHSEATCSDVIRMGGLDAVILECRKNDVETLRHCAGALANLSLYGGAENQEAMIKRKVPMWLFPLAFHNDDNIKYYACLAIAVLVANKEIEAAVLKSGTLDLVEPFITSHNPYEFAKSNLAYAHGQSEQWLRRLVPVLSSKREEARNLAAFHFCMEAGMRLSRLNFRSGNTLKIGPNIDHVKRNI